jgi:hypothetical protein
LFDKAFKEYANRWAFKHPKPADFFRTMEDASAVDLDWFWKGWFYTTDNVDLSIDQVKWFKLKNNQTNIEKKQEKAKEGDLANAVAAGSASAARLTAIGSRGLSSTSSLSWPGHPRAGKRGRSSSACSSTADGEDLTDAAILNVNIPPKA